MQVVRKASRKKAKMRLGIQAPAGGGKTMGALLVAYGLTGDWSKVGLVDTEKGSGELYVGHQVPGTTIVIGEFLYWNIDSPYSISKYIQGQKALEEAGAEAIVHDSTSHAWAGAGGLLDKQGKIAAKSGNSYTAWRDVTPEHNLFVETMLSSPAHIIATMRSKTEYVLEKDGSGKMIPRKIGMAPIQREGMDYEFTVMFDIDQNHTATATKDRTSLFDGEYFKLSPETGRKMLDWLNSGIDTPFEPVPKSRGPQDWLHDVSLILANVRSMEELTEVVNTEKIAKVVPRLKDGYLSDWEALLAGTMDRLQSEDDGSAANEPVEGEVE